MGDDGREGMSETGRDDRQTVQDFERCSDRQKKQERDRERERSAVVNNNNNQHLESCYNKYDKRFMNFVTHDST